jgi:hypothetical protein
MRHAPLAEAALRRLSLFSSEVKRRAAAIWEAAKRVWQWWLKPRGSWGLQRAWQWLKLRPQVAFLLAGIIVLLLGQHWYFFEQKDSSGVTHHPHADVLNPIAAAIGGAILAWAAFRQADTASRRHKEQTDADRQRRITEGYSKAVGQLASDKIEERLGGIYTLERISKESPDDYWTVMETLTAFVRERTRRTEAERTSVPFEKRIAERAYFLWENAGRPEGRSEAFRDEAIRLEKLGEPPPTDIAAVLIVIDRRIEKDRNRERDKGWRLDFHEVVLRRADFYGMYLDSAKFFQAHLEGAYLMRAHLERADLMWAHLQGADLREATGLKDDQLAEVHGDAFTRLPANVNRPTHWPPEAPEEPEGPPATWLDDLPR